MPREAAVGLQDWPRSQAQLVGFPSASVASGCSQVITHCGPRQEKFILQHILRPEIRNEGLLEGWDPHGLPVGIFSASSNFCWFQAFPYW